MVGLILLVTLLAAGLVAIAALSALWASHTPPWYRMGSPTWEFQQSWGANVTIGTALLGTLLTLTVFPDRVHWMDKNSYTLLQTLLAALIALAPLLYGLFRNDVQVNIDGKAAELGLYGVLGLHGVCSGSLLVPRFCDGTGSHFHTWWMRLSLRQELAICAALEIEPIWP
jgi:hypothetical protein